MKNLLKTLNFRNLPAWGVLLVCVALTLLAWNGLRIQNEKNAEQQFQLHVRDVINSIDDRMRQHEQILLGAAGLFDASDFVSRASWRAYVERLNLKQNYPGIQGVGFSQAIKPSELKAHVVSVQKEGFPNYTVRPAGERPLYTSIVYIEPFSGRNLRVFGFDMMSEATRAKAMRLSVELNGARISHKVKLLQETQDKVQAGVLIYLPVYRKGMPISTVEQRWAALLGFVYSPYRMDDLMSGVLGGRTAKLDFSIYDGETENLDTRLFSSTEESRSKPARMSVSHTLKLYGNSWTVRLSSRPNLEAEFGSQLSATVLVLGGSISGLLFLMVTFLSTRRKKAEEIAELMTANVRKNESELRMSQARMRAILEGAGHIIISSDSNGLIQTFNGAAERSLGYRADEVIGKMTPAVFHNPDEVLHRAQELTASGIPVEPGFEVFVALARNNPLGDTCEWTYKRKDGSTFPVSLTVTALHDESGAVNAFLGIATDISAQIQARQLRHDDEERMKAILDNVLDGIITINERGSIESFNKAAQNIFGYTVAEVLGSNVKMLMPEPYHGEHDGYLHNYVSTSHKKIIGIGRQVVGQRKDGSTFPMDLAVSEMQLGDKRMFTGIVRDITERVKIERMKSEFISTVSHELRTPLTSIRGALALITGGVVGEMPAAAKPMLDIAHKNSERLILLVNDILDMEKISAGKMEFDIQPLTLMPLLQQALDGNRGYAEQFKVSYELESELPGVMVRADANRLMQVIANLLSNAAKFSPQGGRVCVAVERIGSRIRVSVKDNGSGITDEFKGKIFQKFAQADASDTKKKGGTGLGLSITKAIVEQMGGSIDFKSTPDVLTTFYFEFPEWREEKQLDRERMAAINRNVAGENSRLPRVLHVEDDADVSHVVQNVASRVAKLDQARSLAEARRMLAQHRYELVILDLTLPDGSGMELLPLLDSAQARIPVLVFSADELKLEHAQKVDAAVVKSRTDNAHLLATIERLIGGA